jgi:A/G-specific adenine glycosylase
MGADRTYTLWVVETMSQQTRIATVAARLPDFLTRFPDVHALAAAPRDAVLAAWAGLGYYRRAHALHEAARSVAECGWPRDETAWRALPGVGPYTAAVMAAAEGAAAIAIDGNVRRVGRRYLAARDANDAALRERLEAAFAPATTPVGEALIELGATLCTPQRPRCPACPLAAACAGARSGDPTAYDPPRRAATTLHVTLHAHLSIDARGFVALERRPPQGWWGGLHGPPWRDHPPTNGIVLGRFTHLLTHRTIGAVVHRTPTPPEGASVDWYPPDDLRGVGLARIDQRALALLRG